MCCTNFLVICATAGYRSSANTIGSLFQKCVYSSFSMKMVLNCVHIWFVDLFLVEDKAPERVFVGMQQQKVGTMPTGLVWNC